MSFKYLDARNKYAFQILFGTEENKMLAIDFFNSVLGFEADDEIATIEYITLESKSHKYSCIDSVCYTKSGHFIAVQLAIHVPKLFEANAHRYATEVLSEIKEDTIPKSVYFIAICDSEYFINERLSHLEYFSFSRDKYMKNFFIKCVHLDRITTWPMLTPFQKWCYLLKYSSVTNEQQVPNIVGNHNILNSAFNILDATNWNDDGIELYHLAVSKEIEFKASEQKIKNEAKFIAAKHNWFEIYAILVIRICIRFKMRGDTIDSISDALGLTKAEVERC